ncbi:unnamed protein product, partial [Ectocarpus fasciculatus]
LRRPHYTKTGVTTSIRSPRGTHKQGWEKSGPDTLRYTSTRQEIQHEHGIIIFSSKPLTTGVTFRSASPLTSAISRKDNEESTLLVPKRPEDATKQPQKVL